MIFFNEQGARETYEVARGIIGRWGREAAIYSPAVVQNLREGRWSANSDDDKQFVVVGSCCVQIPYVGKNVDCFSCEI